MEIHSCKLHITARNEAMGLGFWSSVLAAPDKLSRAVPQSYPLMRKMMVATSQDLRGPGQKSIHNGCYVDSYETQYTVYTVFIIVPKHH